MGVIDELAKKQKEQDDKINQLSKQFKKETEEELIKVYAELDDRVKKVKEAIEEPIKHNHRLENLNELRQIANSIKGINDRLENNLSSGKNIVEKLDNIQLPSKTAYKRPLYAIYGLAILFLIGLSFAVFLIVYLEQKDMYGLAHANDIEKYRKVIKEDRAYMSVIEPLRKRVKTDDDGWYYIDFTDNNTNAKTKGKIANYTEFISLHSREETDWLGNVTEPRKYLGRVRVYLGKQ